MPDEARALLASKLILQARLRAINNDTAPVYKIGPEGREQAARDQRYREELIETIKREIAEGPKASDVELFERNGELHIPADFFASIALEAPRLTELKQHEAVLRTRIPHQTEAQAELIAVNMSLQRYKDKLTTELNALCRQVTMQRRFEAGAELDYSTEYMPGRLNMFAPNGTGPEHAHWRVRFTSR